MAATKKTTTRKQPLKKVPAAKKVAEVVQEAKPVEQKELTVMEAMAERSKKATVTPVETPVGVVNVRKALGFDEMVTLVSVIVELCTDSTTGEIKWQVYDYISKLMIVSVYCNIPAPEDTEVGYAAVCGEYGLFNTIKDYIDKEQLEHIFADTRRILDARESLNESTAVAKLNDFLKNVEGLINELSGVTQNFDSKQAVEALAHLASMTGNK